MKTSHAFRTWASGKILFVGIAGMCFALSAQAGDGAAPGTSRTQVVVTFDDLDLSSKAGARTLYARLKGAAQQVCGNRPDGHDLKGYMSYQSCYGSALEKAVRKVDNAHLLALHRKSADSSLG
jgi:UrcA family protein